MPQRGGGIKTPPEGTKGGGPSQHAWEHFVHRPPPSPPHLGIPSSTPTLLWVTADVLPCITPTGARMMLPAGAAA